MTLDTNWCEKVIQLLIKARGSSWGNTGSTPHFESGESPVSHESSKIPIRVYFPIVSNYDLNPAVSVRFIDSTTLPLHGDPIHIVCDIPLAPWKLAGWEIISSITYRKIES
jgi:hypothetical protein